MKDLVEVLLKRRSIRKYKDAAVAEEKLERILQAALLAPSSRGKTPWSLWWCRIKQCYRSLANAVTHSRCFCQIRPQLLWCWAILLLLMCGWKIAVLP